MKKKKFFLGAISLLALMLTACAGNNTNPSGGESSIAPESIPVEMGGFSNLQGVDEPVEIHTEEQKAYLEYDGDYSTIPEDLYPDGQKHRSDSLPVTISWDYTPEEGKEVDKFAIVFGQESDLSDGYEVEGNNETTISFYNPYLGTNYYKLIAKYTDDTQEETGILQFEVDSTYPRNLRIDSYTNCRDIGGRTTVDGGKIRQGLVYRTCGDKYDYSTKLSDEGKKEMVEHLKMKTEAVVANNSGNDVRLPDTEVVNCYMDYNGGLHHLSRNAESLKKFISLLADEDNFPVFFHCRIGTDRTGLCSIVLNGLLGVDLNEIFQDYLFSNFGYIQEKRYIGDKAGVDNILNYVNFIRSLPGEKFQNKVYNFLLGVGLTAETLDAVIDNLTEGQTCKGNDAGQVSAPGNKLTPNGLTASTSTTNAHPSTYFVLNSADKSVSYSFKLEKGIQGEVYAYLGNSNSNTNKIAAAISCDIDGNALEINDITYKDAGMGNCSNRMNYFLVYLGDVNLAAGDHTITITGTSNTMNIGCLSIFDAETR